MDDGGVYDSRLDHGGGIFGLIFSPFGRDFIVVLTTQILFFIGGEPPCACHSLGMYV